MEKKVDVSIVVPLFNEEESIKPLYDSLKSVLNKINKTYEIIIIDDGSTDSSGSILDKLSENDPTLKVIHFRKNFGQTAGLSAGFDYSCGDVIITMDADLQNDPEDIPKLLEKIDEGYDVASGWRKDRKDKFITRRIPSILANRLISKVTGVRLNDYGCTLKAYKKEVVKNINLYGEMHRFIPAIASWIGVKVTEIPVTHHPRKFGKSKYGISRTFRVVLDLITVKFLLKYTTKPMQFFGKIGIFFFILGTLTGIATIVMKIVGILYITGNPLFLISIMFMIMAVQFVVLGLLGELNMRSYFEIQKKPIYFIKETKNIQN